MATATMRGILHAFEGASVAPKATQRMWIGTGVAVTSVVGYIQWAATAKDNNYKLRARRAAEAKLAKGQAPRY